MTTNKLTFDPPTRLTELTQNVIRSSHGHSTPSLKILCKSVQPFSRNVADKETKTERKKERNRLKTIPRPPTGGGVKIYSNQQTHSKTSRLIRALMTALIIGLQYVVIVTLPTILCSKKKLKTLKVLFLVHCWSFALDVANSKLLAVNDSFYKCRNGAIEKITRP